MGVGNIVKRVGNSAGNKIHRLASLSSDQVLDIANQRGEYLTSMPSMNDDAATLITKRMLAASSVEIFNSYLPQIKEFYLPVDKNIPYSDGTEEEIETLFDVKHNIRFMEITKWVTDKNENSLEKLVNVYAVLSEEDCNIALVFNRTQNGTKVYLAVVNNDNANNNNVVNSFTTRLLEAVKGNFPGSEIKLNTTDYGNVPFIKNDRRYSVATATNIPTEKSEKFISQTIEKLLDGTVPDTKKKEYTLILLATPVNNVEERKLQLGDFYSGMSPYASWQTNYTVHDNKAVSAGATVGINVGASAGIQNGTNNMVTNSDTVTDQESSTNTDSSSSTVTDSISETESCSDSYAESHNYSDTQTIGESTSTNTTETSTTTTGRNRSSTSQPNIITRAWRGIVGGETSTSRGRNSSTSTSTVVNEVLQRSRSTARTIGKAVTSTQTHGSSSTVGQSIGQTVGQSVSQTLGRAVSRGVATAAGVSKAVSFGANAGANFARTSTVTAMVGKDEGLIQTFTNYNIKHTLEYLENQMKRFDLASALGMWDFAAYVISEDSDVANNVAHTYLSLTLGEESYMSKSAINLWKANATDTEDGRFESDVAQNIVSYLKELRHPIFALNSDLLEMDRSFNVYPTLVTATSCLSGKELAYSLNFPSKSVAGLPVFECAEFGRNVVSYDVSEMPESTIKLGQIFHMNNVENNIVELSKNSLTSHTFITGSTGSGKSNTVYQMLSRARKDEVKFLVVEPAKGEYKHIFGNYDDVAVYGTNPLLTQLLRINPFSFPKEIHILEHLDRLIEIFNVCWPMYAAMPAVLKQAVEQAYIQCGWDLVRSKNIYDEDLYPTFADVANNVKTIIDSSEYDSENKGAYKGSLLTRLQSLVNGVNGLIFVTDEIEDTKLFDENVIVDLSRVGSMETKALIMGMLVLKLQEHRMSLGDMNSPLKHLTVLEEAHNLLKRTSTEQVAESSNLLGKSVEMLANAIAEMRTYGEGFIIADQAPGLLDLSVIRNTNTKIIMRLPDKDDRELVGRAANLNDDQVIELAKLPCGVAAVYQNEWIQPVLCKIDRYNSPSARYDFNPESDLSIYDKKDDVKETLLDYIMNYAVRSEKDEKQLFDLKKLVAVSRLDTSIKKHFIEYANGGEQSIPALRNLLCEMLAVSEPLKECENCTTIYDWAHAFVPKLKPSIGNYTNEQIDLALSLILYDQSLKDGRYNNLLISFVEVFKEKGGVY